MSERLDVRKTYKLFIGGKFPRSESGRSYEVADSKGKFLANAAMASRKDARDAVVAARKAFPGWSAATAYNRGQVLYRVAELLEGRRDQFVEEVAAGEGLSRSKAEAAVDAAIDRWVWYAGWSDKVAQVAGSANPVAGPVLRLLGARADRRRGRAGTAGLLAARPGLGDRAGDRHRQHGGRAVASELRPLPAVTLSEVLATSDVPGGVVNVLTGRTAEVAPWLASHMDVNAIDLAGAPRGQRHRAAGGGGRQPQAGAARRSATDWTATPGLGRLLHAPRDQDGLAPDRRLTGGR